MNMVLKCTQIIKNRLLKITILVLIIIFNYNSTLTFASPIKYVQVGLSKLQNKDTISIENNEILFGEDEKNEFKKDFSLNTKNKFTLKPLTIYTIRLKKAFGSYEDALKYSSNYENSFIIKNNNWYIALGEFTYQKEAEKILYDNKIEGTIHKIDKNIGIYIDDKLKVTYKDKLAMKVEFDFFNILGKTYRGILEIKNENNKLNVINLIDIEQYLYSVVASEMPASWNIEALKAQAIIARSYIQFNKDLHRKDSYDVCDTTHCQVYNGVESEKPTTTKAVEETRGIMIYYSNNIINAVYSSSNGGYSANSEDVWNEKIPYLRAIEDKEETNARIWEREVSFNELTKILNIGEVTEVIAIANNESKRIISLQFIGKDGQKTLNKEDIRTFFSKIGGSLPSRKFTILSEEKSKKKDVNSNEVFSISAKSINIVNDTKNIKTINANSKLENMSIKFILDNKDEIIELNTKRENPIKDTIFKVNKDETEKFIISGMGFGHGVGLSQYGANSLAKNGYKFDEILKFYYTGVEVK